MKTNTAEPLLFVPVYQERIWGNGRIARHFNRNVPVATCGESWEISARPGQACHIENGPDAGRTLDAAWPDWIDPPHPFPLLAKLIDAQQTLSVQVHPGLASARRFGGKAKNEMWYVLATDPDTVLYAGFQPGVTPSDLMAAVNQGTVESLLNRIAVRPGHAVFIPGGCVHAIGAGCLLYEIQQNSDTTYRLFDWNRKDEAGRARELHIEQALRVIDWDLPQPQFRETASRTGRGPRLASPPILDTPYFQFQRHTLARGETLTLNPGLHVLFSEKGVSQLRIGHRNVRLESGRSALFPPGDGSRQVDGESPTTTLLITSLPPPLPA